MEVKEVAMLKNSSEVNVKYFRNIFSNLEREIEYLSGDLARVKVFGKVYPIPRKQAG